MVTCRRELAKLIYQLSLEKGQFQLASGVSSSNYIDLSKTLYTDEGLSKTSWAIFTALNGLGHLWDQEDWSWHEIDAIGGPATGALPLVAGLLSIFQQYRDQKAPIDLPRRGFFVRKESKTYGKEDLIEGQLRPEDSVILVEDVTTSGQSLYKAIEAVEKFGAQVVHVISVIDRQQGATKLFQEKGYPFTWLLSLDEILEPIGVGCVCCNRESQ